MSRYRLALALLVGVCACKMSGSSPPVSPNKLVLSDLIQFEAHPPDPPNNQSEFPVFGLSIAPPRKEFLEQLPSTVEANSRLNDGTLEFHPRFDELAQQDEKVKFSREDGLVQKTVERMKLAFPNDEEWSPEDAQVLSYARAHRRGDGSDDEYEPEQPKLLYVTLRRRVNQWKVDGPGSRFTVAVAANGEIKGVVYYWKQKTPTVGRAHVREAVDVESEIRRQLIQTEPRSVIVVRSIEYAYYDASLETLQPVYRYVAEVTQSNGSVGRNNFYVGYVPLGQTKEVPTEVGGKLSEATYLKEIPSSNSNPPKRKGQGLAIGRYVAYDDKAGWSRDAEEFWDELNAHSGNFSDEQHLFAERMMFTSRKDWFANFVDVALVEAHGVPLGFTTFLRHGGEINLYRDVPLSGYGEGSGGKLKHLVLHSCRAVPTGVDYFDNPKRPWAKAWWDLFNGLSSVVGYRSSMFIDDGAGAAFGRNIARGAPVVPAWFGAVASLHMYGDGWIKSECADNEPVGRAAAIAVCGAGSKATADQGAAGRPDCLEAWWLNDELLPFDPSSTPRVASGSTGKCPDEGGGRPPFPKSPPK